jgi:predicted nucleic acid-binding protein
MNLLFDTDILSTFGKIRRLYLLRELFLGAKFFIPHSVYNELFKARERGYEFVDYIIESRILEVTHLNEEELEFLSKLREERRSLGLGELEGVSICKHR